MRLDHLLSKELITAARRMFWWWVARWWNVDEEGSPSVVAVAVSTACVSSLWGVWVWKVVVVVVVVGRCTLLGF